MHDVVGEAVVPTLSRHDRGCRRYGKLL